MWHEMLVQFSNGSPQHQIGLSIGTATVSPSLRDDLTGLDPPVGNDAVTAACWRFRPTTVEP